MARKIFYNGYAASVRHADCRLGIPRIPKRSIDLVVSSPPYFIGKSYDESKSLQDYADLLRNVIQKLKPKLSDTASVCWQVGNHISSNGYTPLDFLTHDLMSTAGFKLQNRIIWTFGHGTHATKRFSGRYETVLWYSKNDSYKFNLDDVRIPQKYPGKRHYKGEKKGEFSGNPKGKNPGDVWDIPNVKAQHVEKTEHDCQFPIALADRLIRALSSEGDLVLDPFLGSGTTAVSAIRNKRNCIGYETELRFVELAKCRIKAVADGTIGIRADVPPIQPDTNTSVATKPEHFDYGQVSQ